MRSGVSRANALLLVAVFVLALPAVASPDAVETPAAVGIPVAWGVQLNGNSAESVVQADGAIGMKALPLEHQFDFPYAVAKPGAFPAEGDFSMAFAITYEKLRIDGDGVVALSADGQALFQIWADVNHGMSTGLLGFTAESGPRYAVADTAGAHTFVLTLTGRTLRVAVDGVPRLAANTTLRPATLWAGHPTLGQLLGLDAHTMLDVNVHVDASGDVAERWWHEGSDEWTTFTLAVTRTDVTLPVRESVCGALTAAVDGANTCCTPALPAGTGTGDTQVRSPAAGLAGITGPVSLKVSGSGCLGKVAPIPEGTVEPAAGLRVLAAVAPQGVADLGLGDDVRIEYRTGDLPVDLDATVAEVQGLADLPSLPGRLPVAAAEAPTTPDGVYDVLAIVQVVPASPSIPDPQAAAFETVRLAMDAPVAVDVPAGAELTILYWDGAGWIDTQEHIGGTIAGNGEPDLQVFAAAPTADGTGATVEVSHTSTYALAVRPAAGNASGGAGGGVSALQWTMLALGVLVVANVGIWGANGLMARSTRRKR